MKGLLSRRPSIKSYLPSSTTTQKRRSIYAKYRNPKTSLFMFRQFICYSRARFVAFFLILFVTGFVVLKFVWRVRRLDPFFYPPEYVRKEVDTLVPLSGCFDESRISPLYNLTQALAPKNYDIQEGRPLERGRDCYNLASTIQVIPGQEKSANRKIFHTYWRVDLTPFEEREEWFLKSFFATQDLDHSRLIIWSNGNLSNEPLIVKWIRVYPDVLQVRRVNVDELARGTTLEGNTMLHLEDTMAWVDGDVIRLLVLWVFGGAWVDMDFLLTRDLSPLLEHEFLMRWDCHDRDYLIFNGAMMHFLRHSPYLCEAFHIMSISSPPRPKSTDWGAILYLKLWRRLIANSITPFKALPWCYVDGRTCTNDNNVPDPFHKESSWWPDTSEGGELDSTLKKIFAVHLHNQWTSGFPKDGWVDRLLLRRYNKVLGL